MFGIEYYVINNNLYVLYQETKKALIMINLENNKISAYPLSCKKYKIIVNNPEDLRQIYKRIR